MFFSLSLLIYPVYLLKSAFIHFTPGLTECNCEGKKTITIGPGVKIEKDAKVTFRAPKVKIISGFYAEEGAVVDIKQQ